MRDDRQPTNLEQLLDRLSEAGEGYGHVSLGTMLDTVGRRSFGPLLLVLGLIALSPLSGVPGIPTTLAVMVLLIGGQQLLGRTHFWLPRFLLRRSTSREKFERTLRFLRPGARFVDKLVRPRLTALTQSAALYAIAVLCIVIAMTMPPLEIVPFANTTAGAALAAFGLALIAHDGILAMVALAFCGTSATLIAFAVF